MLESRIRRAFSQGAIIPWAHGIAFSDFKPFGAENKEKRAFGSQKHVKKRIFTPILQIRAGGWN
ncbi:MAG: hypothetical protein PUI29_06645 [Aeromonadales bacterium]|nr:hypothetical protein [Aeromonadales bacterium]MDY2891593.1 hypothetical protein [Succinivibrio sp.]